MNPKLSKASLYFNLIVLTIVFAGCGPNPYNRHYYILDATRQATPSETQTDVILEVQRFTTDSAFASKQLVYRKSEFEYESDFYGEFLISPGLMITEKTRNWLAHSGLFARVLAPGSYTKPTHTLHANITALYIDTRNKKSPAAVLQMRVFLTPEEPAEKLVILAETYNASVGVKSKDAEDFVEGFNQCLEQILTDLEKDLREQLQSESPDL
ncbi:MAG: membrane integrity-associated transporter subunit PqiC [Planctomycetota bacterium]|nr:MAG: membrane integrity-associated transporter subunit PqiC [Planctomycetota bacterium]